MPPATDALKRQANEVREVFGDLPIIEAKADFVVYVTADEQEHSVKGDPNNCMFSNACKRAFGSKGVLFYPTIAYVDMLDPHDPSRRIVMRFSLPMETRRRLEAFDRGEGVASEATFVLKAIPKSRRLANMAKAQRKYTQNRRMGKPANPQKVEGGKERPRDSPEGFSDGHPQW